MSMTVNYSSTICLMIAYDYDRADPVAKSFQQITEELHQFFVLLFHFLAFWFFNDGKGQCYIGPVFGIKGSVL